MPKLIDSRVRRAGVTANRWTPETRDIEIFLQGGLPKKIGIRFRMASKGGGTSEVEVLIGAKDFSAILRIMCATDQSVALKSMSRELAKQITALRLKSA
jgi:hypothetical protein